jgi:hypothetical protein
MSLTTPPSPTTPAPPNARWELVYTTNVSLNGGEEWTSQPLSFNQGDRIVLRCDSSVRFYSGLFDQAQYATARRRNATIFPFVRGTDSTTNEVACDVPTPMTYRVVLRIGVFAPKGIITASVWKAVVPVAPSTPARMPEDTDADASAARRAWAYFIALLVIVSAAAAWLLWYDFAVITLGNRDAFFSALNAEGTAVFGVVAVAGAVSGVWLALGLPRGKRSPK